jgi:predicted phage terminase large subunit-like protein
MGPALLAESHEIEATFAAARQRRAQLPAVERLAYDKHMAWLAQAHAHQIEPEGNWRTWLLLAGRGAGKTKCAAEWAWWESWRDPGSRTLVTAPTLGDIRDTCFEGESGLLNCIPHQLIKDHNRSLSEIVLVNGSLIKGIPASEPERFRGGQWHRVWADELAAWTYDEDAWQMIMFALRLGKNPRMVATTTPKPKQLIRQLVARSGKDVTITRATSMSNMANLAPTFRDQIMAMEGTVIFRQEALGELVDPEEGGIVKRSQFRLWPHDKPLPQFELVILSLDTAFTEATVDKRSGDPDPTACTVWGLFYHEKRNNVMLLDCWEEHLGLPDLIRKVRRELNTAYGDDDDTAVIKPLFGSSKPLTSGRKPDILLIEDKGSGISLRQMLEREGIEAYAYNPGRADKLTRLHIVSPIFARKMVWLPESAKHPGQPRNWVDPLLHQLCSYTGPGSIKHDDFVDSTSQALRLMMDKRLLDAVQAKKDEPSGPPPKPVSNPYAA